MAINFTDFQKDIFREIGNVGIGNGATALSQMINRDVTITFPNVKLVDIDTIFSLAGEYIVSICALEGDLDGCITAVFDKVNGYKLIDLMFFREVGQTSQIDDEGKGAYNEMLNVIGGCYLNSLADMLGIKLMPKPPFFMAGNLPEIKDAIVQQFDGVSESFFVQTDFKIDGEEIVGNIFLILTPSSNNKVLELINKRNMVKT